jgi:hypothetical protein
MEREIVLKRMKDLDERRKREGQLDSQAADGQDDHHHQCGAHLQSSEVGEGHEAQHHQHSEACSTALERPIYNWTTPEPPYTSQLNILPSTSYPQSSVKATNGRIPNVEIARREIDVQVEEVQVQADQEVHGQVGEGLGDHHHQRDVQDVQDDQAQDTQGPAHHHQHEEDRVQGRHHHHQQDVHHQRVQAKTPKYKEGYCLTSFTAWWKRVEKEERKFYREVDKENDIRDRKKHEKEKKNREKEMFLKKFFPEINNSPGGTLNLKKSRLDITPGRKRAMGKTDDGISDVTPAKKTLTARKY